MDKRSSFSNEVLYDLLTLNTNPCLLKDFYPDESIHRWWEDKTRRPNQQPHKDYAKRARVHVDNAEDESESDENKESELLLEWDEWLRGLDATCSTHTDCFLSQPLTLSF